MLISSDHTHRSSLKSLRYWILFLVCQTCQLLHVQQPAGAQPAGAQPAGAQPAGAQPAAAPVILTLDELYGQITANHPIARQAALFNETAAQELRMARGQFDPKLSYDYSSKYFKNIDYFIHSDAQLKIPVWTGTDIKIGVEDNEGRYLNPEGITAGGNGLIYAGISVPIGQGLLIDQRRAALRQAQVFQDIAEAERVKMLNKLFFQIAKDYWQWYFAYYQERYAREGYDLARFRYNGLVQRVQNGDMAAIDTVEAKILLQQRQIDLRTAEIELTNAKLILSTHLWAPDNQAVELADGVVPVAEPMADQRLELNSLLTFAEKEHPEIIKLNRKLDQLAIERRLAKEMLKPTLMVNYNFLTQNPNTEAASIGRYDQNFKFGGTFAMPIFLRKERAKVQLTEIKISQNTFERTDVVRNIQVQVETAFNQMRNLQDILLIQSDMVNNYQILLRGEDQKFLNGESSLFLVNTRETKLIEARIKLADLRHKYGKAIAELRYVAGMGI